MRDLAEKIPPSSPHGQSFVSSSPNNEHLSDSDIKMVEVSEASGPPEPSKVVHHDHPIFKSVDDGDMERLQNFLEVEGVSVELLDGTGMTPLMHASWKGHAAVAK